MAVPLTFCMQIELHLLKIHNLAPSKGTADECSSPWHTSFLELEAVILIYNRNLWSSFQLQGKKEMFFRLQ